MSDKEEKDSNVVVQETSEETAVNPESNVSDTHSSNNDTPTSAKENKIEVLLKATGDAPIMKNKKWAVSPDKTIGWISEFIKKLIKMGAEERLFLYINQTFAPAPDQIVQNLYDCYGSDGKLIIHYCKSQAWG